MTTKTVRIQTDGAVCEIEFDFVTSRLYLKNAAFGYAEIFFHNGIDYDVNPIRIRGNELRELDVVIDRVKVRTREAPLELTGIKDG